MRVNEFLELVSQYTRSEMPARYRRFHSWKRYTLIQLYYTKRSIHYEVWIRGGEIHALEIGLHCEADAATNRALLDTLDARLFEIQAELGGQVEAEQWTQSWTRVHELMPYQQLDDATARACAKKLAQMIQVIQPMLETKMVRAH